MNRYIALFLLGTSFLLLTCQETKDDLNNPLSEVDAYKLIGEEIPFETGMEWIAYYRNHPSKQGRTDLLTSYSVSDSQMLELLSSVESLVGVAFHYGIDGAGQTHILVIPVDESLLLWSSIPGRIFVDANTGAEISQGVAAAWAETYRNAHPSDIWFHFFGANIFDDMCALPFFDSVEIEKAINVLGLTPELLLVVYNNDLLGLGRTQSSPGAVYDASNACPPCACR